MKSLIVVRRDQVSRIAGPLDLQFPARRSLHFQAGGPGEKDSDVGDVRLLAHSCRTGGEVGLHLVFTKGTRIKRRLVDEALHWRLGKLSTKSEDS